MSGGSINLNGDRNTREFAECRADLERYLDRIPDSRVRAEFDMLLALCDIIDERWFQLHDVVKALDYYVSGDWSETQLAEECAEYLANKEKP